MIKIGIAVPYLINIWDSNYRLYIMNLFIIPTLTHTHTCTHTCTQIVKWYSLKLIYIMTSNYVIGVTHVLNHLKMALIVTNGSSGISLNLLPFFPSE